MRTGILPSLLVALLMAVAALRYAGNHDLAEAAIAVTATALAVLAAVESSSNGRRRPRREST